MCGGWAKLEAHSFKDLEGLSGLPGQGLGGTQSPSLEFLSSALWE